MSTPINLSPRQGGFVVTCPRCGGTDCRVGAFTPSDHAVGDTGGAPQPLIDCNKCGYGWHPLQSPRPRTSPGA
jgi:hypothetical protein